MMRPKINRPVPQRMKPAPSLPASSVDSSLRTEASVVIRNFLFCFENATIVHRLACSRHCEAILSSGALPTVCHPHQHSPKLPHLWPTSATRLLIPTLL